MKHKKTLAGILACSVALSVFAGSAVADETEESLGESEVTEETILSEETELSEVTEETEVTEVTEETEVSEEAEAAEVTEVTEVTEITEVTEVTEVTEETETDEEIEEIEDLEVENAYSISAKNFPDEALRSLVEEFDINNNGTLTQTEIDAVTEITIYRDIDPAVKDLTGIRIFGNLQSITIYNTDMDVIDLSDMDNLRTVYIENDNVVSVDVSDCNRLDNLKCICGSMTSLSFAGCNSLLEIQCSNCYSLTSLDLSGAGCLERLDCSDSGLTSINCAGTGIRYLTLKNNNLSSIDLSGMDELRILYLDGNKISSLDLSETPVLQWALEGTRVDNGGSYSLVDYMSGSVLSIDNNVAIKGVFTSPSKVNISGVTDNSVKVSWDTVTDATGYEVWRSTEPEIGFVCIYQGSGNSKISTNLLANTTYYYKIRAYKTVGDKKIYSGYSRVASAVTIPAPKISNITVLSGNKIKISWNSVSGAAGYQIGYTGANGNYCEYANTTGNSIVVSLTDTMDYSRPFTVRAYRLIGGSKAYGQSSSTMNLVNNQTPSNVRLTNIGRNSVTVSWRAGGTDTLYEVWRSKSPSSGFVCLGRYTNTVKVSTSLSPNTTYYYKVRAYSYVYDDNGVIHRYYTGYSNVVSATTKK